MDGTGTREEERLPVTRRIPTYVWTFLALVTGLAAGGLLPGPLAPVADATSVLIAWVVAVVPLLILAALSPAIATLVKGAGLPGASPGQSSSGTSSRRPSPGSSPS